MRGSLCPCKTVSLDDAGGRIISQELSEALDSAGGCIFVWPVESGPDDENQPGADGPGATLGASSYRLGEKLIVVLRDSSEAADGSPADPAIRSRR